MREAGSSDRRTVKSDAVVCRVVRQSAQVAVIQRFAVTVLVAHDAWDRGDVCAVLPFSNYGDGPWRELVFVFAFAFLLPSPLTTASITGHSTLKAAPE